MGTPSRGTRLLLASAGLAGPVLAALWWFTFVAVLPGRSGPSLLLSILTQPDQLLGSNSPPDTPLELLLQFDAPAVLLSLLAIGLWVASSRSRTAAVAAALLISAAIATVLVGAFPYDMHAYQTSQVQGIAAPVYLGSLVGGVVLAGVGLLRAGRRRWGVFSIAFGVVLAWIGVIASGLGALAGAKQPQLVTMLVFQLLATVWFAAIGIELVWLSRLGSWPSTRRPSRFPYAGTALTALGAAGTAVILVATSGYFGPIVAAQLTGRTQVATLKIGSVTRSYRVYRPAEVAARPGLVILLHGAYGSGLQMEIWTRFNSQADRMHWIAAYPDGVLDGWDTYGDSRDWGQHPGADDVQFIAALIDHLEATDQVDPARVYMTGISRGAMMSYRLGCELASRVAAVAPVSGNMATSSGSARDVGCAPARPVSVLAIQGTDDPVVPFSGGTTDITYAPFDEVIGVWRGVDVCAESSSSSASGPTTTTTWACRGGSVVETRVIAGGVHAWPGARPTAAQPLRISYPPDDSFDASSFIADFFAAHPLPRAQ